MPRLNVKERSTQHTSRTCCDLYTFTIVAGENKNAVDVTLSMHVWILSAWWATLVPVHAATLPGNLQTRPKVLYITLQDKRYADLVDWFMPSTNCPIIQWFGYFQKLNWWHNPGPVLPWGGGGGPALCLGIASATSCYTKVHLPRGENFGSTCKLYWGLSISTSNLTRDAFSICSMGASIF